MTSIGDSLSTANTTLLCIFIIEGNANFQLEGSGNNEVNFFFVSKFTETPPPSSVSTDTSPPPTRPWTLG